MSFTTEIVNALEIALPGPPEVATFIVLVLTLIFRPRGLFGSEA